MKKVKELAAYFEKLAPSCTAESWDNVGFLCGDGEAEVSRVLVALDVTEEVIEEAVQQGCQLILSHHPLIFRGMKQITENTLEGRKLRKLIAHQINVISLHTNMDVAQDGVNHQLACQLGLEQVELLHTTWKEGYQKIEVMVPVGYESAVADAMFQAGGGQWGSYSHCAFQSQGEGSFLPLPGSQPFLGAQGKLEHTAETKVEMIAPASAMGKAIAAMRSAHPYETPAYQVMDTHAPEKALGLGRIGNLPREMGGEEFLQWTKERLGCSGLRYTGKKETVRRVAVGGGACGEFAGEAFAKGADVYVTADLKYHEFLDAKEKGWFLVDAGHFETENAICAHMAQLFTQEFGEDVVPLLSQVHRSAIEFF